VLDKEVWRQGSRRYKTRAHNKPGPLYQLSVFGSFAGVIDPMNNCKWSGGRDIGGSPTLPMPSPSNLGVVMKVYVVYEYSDFRGLYLNLDTAEVEAERIRQEYRDHEIGTDERLREYIKVVPMTPIED
jgi:hypothetical protein